jgi:prepilin-type N-terminal cleavage/methylation domain-containing protein
MAQGNSVDRPGGTIGVRRYRRGFTAIELIIVIVMISVMTAFGYPRIAREIRRSRAIQAATIVAADVEVAFSLAGRERRPDNWSTY